MQAERYPTEIALLSSAAGGDPDAVRALIDSVGPVVYGFVFARVGGDEPTAQDLLQETLIEALRSACNEMGLALLQNVEARGYYENKVKGEFVVRLKGHYDIALNKQPDDSFGLTADLWQGHVEQEVGQGYGKLLQFYGVHKAMREARKKGHLVRRSQQQDGAIKLVIAVA